MRNFRRSSTPPVATNLREFGACSDSRLVSAHVAASMMSISSSCVADSQDTRSMVARHSIVPAAPSLSWLHCCWNAIFAAAYRSWISNTKFEVHKFFADLRVTRQDNHLRIDMIHQATDHCNKTLHFSKQSSILRNK